ncbi:MAG: InlB B-repeat-containing protein [Christensenellales bacterium]
MKRKIFVVIFASILSAFVLSFALYKIVDYSNHYEITLTVDYGNRVLLRTLEAGETYLMPRVPDREGYTFVGWYSDKARTKEFDFNKPLRHNTTIYAKWEENKVESNE